MKGWQKLTEAALQEAEQQDITEAEMLRESSDSESDPSVIPTSSQTSDDTRL